MNTTSIPHNLNQLRNKIDVTRVPFSDRGSRVLLFKDPQHSSLSIRLAERPSFLDPGRESNLKPSPFLQNLELIDAAGQPLAFAVSSWPHTLALETRLGAFGVAFQDLETLAFGLPPETTVGLRFFVSSQDFHAGPTGGASKGLRNLACSTNAQVLRDEIIPRAGGCTVELLARSGTDSAITLNFRPDPELNYVARPFSETLAQAAARWGEWFNRVPPVAETYLPGYYYAWWIMGNNLISPRGRITHASTVPSNNSYIGAWQWDTALHVLAYRHGHSDVARDGMRAFFSQQMPDGMLPDAIFDGGVVTEIDHPIPGVVTKPPLMAWAACKLHQIDPCPEFFAEIYPQLVRLNRWWTKYNADHGLIQYNHPYSSGADDNPLWGAGMPVISPDINTYLTVDMTALATIAETLGRPAEARLWRKRSAALARRMIASLWDPRQGVFQALHDKKPIPVLTPFALYPLWTGELPAAIQERLIAHLTDPREFWGEYALPTVARNDPHYNPEKMWSGPVWANINYFFIEALQKTGQAALAQALRDKTLALIMQQNDIYEYYHAETGLPPEKAAAAFAWTAAVFIDLAVQANTDLTTR